MMFTFSEIIRNGEKNFPVADRYFKVPPHFTYALYYITLLHHLPQKAQTRPEQENKTGLLPDQLWSGHQTMTRGRTCGKLTDGEQSLSSEVSTGKELCMGK